MTHFRMCISLLIRGFKQSQRDHIHVCDTNSVVWLVFVSSSSCNRYCGCASGWKWNYTQGMCILIIHCSIHEDYLIIVGAPLNPLWTLLQQKDFEKARLAGFIDKLDHIDPGFVLNLVVRFLAGDYNRPPPRHSTTFSCECANMSPYQLLFSPWGKSLHHITSPWRFFWLGCPFSTNVMAGPQGSLPI